MPALPPYVPARDTDMNAWASNFSTLLTASPTTYGQTSGVAVTVAASYAAWLAAYTPILSPSTKTAAAVAAKNSARVSLLANLRPVAVAISLNPAVLTASKSAIGVNPRTSTPTPITVPSTYPSLLVQGGASLQLYVRYRDSAASPSVKAKPYGVASVRLNYGTSATPITDPTLLNNVVLFNKTPYLLQFLPADGGKQCYMAGAYVLRNSKVSGYSPVVSFTVPVGS